MFSWLFLRYFLKYSFYCYALEMPCLSRPTKGLDSPICRDTKSFATKQREGDGGLGEGGHFHDPVKQQNFDNDRYSIWSKRVFDGEIYSVGGLNLKIISDGDDDDSDHSDDYDKWSVYTMMMIKDDQCTRVSEANAVINDRRKARQGLLDHFQTTLEVMRG